MDSYDYNESTAHEQQTMFSLKQSLNRLDNALNNGEDTFISKLNRPEPSFQRPPIFPALQRSMKDQYHPHKIPTLFGRLKAMTPSPSPLHNVPRYTSDQTMKEEHFSTRNLSPSPGPRSHSPNAHTLICGPDTHHMLPPPPQPKAPIARPTTPERRRSRSLSVTPFAHDEPVGSPPSDLPDIAVKALREVKTLNCHLADQRRHTQSLLSQLNMLSSSHDVLKSADLANRRRIEELAQELTATKDVLATERDRLAVVRDELDGSRREALAFESDREEGRKRAGKLKHGINVLGTSLKDLKVSFDSLKAAYDASREVIEDLRKAKSWAEDSLRVLNDAEECTRATSVKAVMRELQDELANSHRVNDMLRDKLYSLSAQLAEAQGRLREMEQGEKECLTEVVQWLRGLEGEPSRLALAGKMDALVERMIIRERETLDVLVETAGTKERLGVARARIEQLEKALEEKETALKDVTRMNDVSQDRVRVVENAEKVLLIEHAEQKAKVQEQEKKMIVLEVQLADLNEVRGKFERATRKLVEEEVVRAGLEARLVEVTEAQRKAEEELHSQAVLNATLDVQLVDLRRSLGAAQENVEKKLEEVKAVEVRLAGIQVKSEMMEQEMAVLMKEVREKEELIRQATAKASTVQERFDAQGITLSLTKEQCVDLQDRLNTAENALMTTKAEIAILNDRNNTLQNMVEEAKREQKTEVEVVRAESEKKVEAVRVEWVKKVEGVRVEWARTQATTKTEIAILNDRNESLQNLLAEAKREQKEVEAIGVENEKKWDALRVEWEKNVEGIREEWGRRAESTKAEWEKKLAKSEEESAKRIAKLNRKIEDGEREGKEKVNRMEREGQERMRKCEDAAKEAMKKQEVMSERLVEAVRKQKEKADAEVEELRERLGNQERAVEKKAQRGEKVVEELVESGKRMRVRIEVLEREKRELEGERMRLEGELVKAEEAGRVLVVTQLERERVRELERVLEELERTNEALVRSAETLLQRYEANELLDHEKDFAGRLFKDFNELHEQDNVAKANDLRRKDNIITALNAKTREFESTLARLLKEREDTKGTVATSLVDINVWLSSPTGQRVPSPAIEATGTTTPTPDTGPVPAVVAPLSKVEHVKHTTSRAAPQAQMTHPPPPVPTFGYLQRESSELSSDSEEDVPVSESGPVPVLGKRDRVATPLIPPVKVEKKGKAKEKTALRPRRMRNAGNRLVPQCFSSSPPKGQSVAATKKTELEEAGPSVKSRKKRK